MTVITHEAVDAQLDSTVVPSHADAVSFTAAVTPDTLSTGVTPTAAATGDAGDTGDEVAAPTGKHRGRRRRRRTRKAVDDTASVATSATMEHGDVEGATGGTFTYSESVTDVLTHSLSHRPSAESLRQAHILREPGEDEARLAETISRLDKQLATRPRAEELLERKVLHGTGSTHAQLQVLQDSISRALNRDALARSLRKRPPVEALMKARILRDSEDDAECEDGEEHAAGSVSSHRGGPRRLRGVGAKLEPLIERRPRLNDVLRAQLIKDVMMWTQLEVGAAVHAGDANAPVAPRNCHTCTLVGRYMIVLGGYSLQEITCHPDVLNINGSCWERPVTRSATARMPLPRYAHTAVPYGPYLIMFGGYGSMPTAYAQGSASISATGVWLNDVWILDTTPAARGTPMAHTTAAAHASSAGLSLPPQFALAETSPQWTATSPAAARLHRGMRLTPPAALASADASQAWASAAAFAADTSDGGVEFMWHLPSVTGTPPPARAAHTAVVCGGHMLVFGGNNGSTLYNDSCALRLGVADAGQLQWTALEATGSIPTPRSGHSAVMVGTRMIVFGGGEGWGADCFNDLHVLDCDFDANVFMWLRPAFTGMPPAPRTGHCAAIVRSSMFVFGGGDAKRALNDLHILHVDTMTWSRPSDTGAVPRARAGHSMTAAADMLVLFGGATPEGACFNDMYVLDTRYSYYDAASASESEADSSRKVSAEEQRRPSSSAAVSTTTSVIATTLTSTSSCDSTAVMSAAAGGVLSGSAPHSSGQRGGAHARGHAHSRSALPMTAARHRTAWPAKATSTVMLADALDSSLRRRDTAKSSPHFTPVTSTTPSIAATPDRVPGVTAALSVDTGVLPAAAVDGVIAAARAAGDTTAAVVLVQQMLEHQRRDDEERFATMTAALATWRAQRELERASMLALLQSLGRS